LPPLDRETLLVSLDLTEAAEVPLQWPRAGLDAALFALAGSGGAAYTLGINVASRAVAGAGDVLAYEVSAPAKGGTRRRIAPPGLSNHRFGAKGTFGGRGCPAAWTWPNRST
jgi:hypothetical protein